jgi:hypothetical protein
MPAPIRKGDTMSAKANGIQRVFNPYDDTLAHSVTDTADRTTAEPVTSNTSLSRKGAYIRQTAAGYLVSVPRSPVGRRFERPQ